MIPAVESAVAKGIRVRASRGRMLFSEEQMWYLRSLPAVQSVTSERIQYTEAFKRECVRRSRLGESPTKLFRKAGLDSRLVGAKRIERCMARWRKKYDGVELEAPSDDFASIESVIFTVSDGRSTRRQPAMAQSEPSLKLDPRALALRDDIIAKQQQYIDYLERQLAATQRSDSM